MNFKQEYKFYPINRQLSDDADLTNVLNMPELSHLKEWYVRQPDFELVKDTPDGGYETIQILLNDVAYAIEDTGLSDELDDAFIIGNDGGDNLYVYIFNKNYKTGIYRIDDVLNVEDMEFVSDTLDNWLLD